MGFLNGKVTRNMIHKDVHSPEKSFISATCSFSPKIPLSLNLFLFPQFNFLFPTLFFSCLVRLIWLFWWEADIETSQKGDDKNRESGTEKLTKDSNPGDAGDTKESTFTANDEGTSLPLLLIMMTYIFDVEGSGARTRQSTQKRKRKRTNDK